MLGWFTACEYVPTTALAEDLARTSCSTSLCLPSADEVVVDDVVDDVVDGVVDDVVDDVCLLAPVRRSGAMGAVVLLAPVAFAHMI